MATHFTVLQLVPSLESGGVERGTLEVAAELVRRGHSSLVISGGGRLVSELKASGTRHFSWPIGGKSPGTLRWIVPLRKLLLAEGVDIVHARSRVPAWLAWLAIQSLPKARRPKFLTTAHGLYSVNAYSAIMTRGERVIAISRTVQNYLDNNYPRLDSARVRLIHRGVDAEEFPYRYQPAAEWQRAWNDKFGYLAGKRLLTLPGRLTRLKGHTAFLDLIEAVRRDVPEAHGLIVGGEDPRRRRYAEELRAAICERGLASHVTFTGHRSDIREIYAISDVVLSLSANPPEAFGRTALEALMLGVPVVGFAQGGIGEILETIYPAGAVAPGRIEEAAARVIQILKHGAQVPPSNQFSRQQMLNATLGVYEELAA